jgi:hypothetical protein
MVWWKKKSFQDYYPAELSHCYGCGRLDEEGFISKVMGRRRIVARLTPQSHIILQRQVLFMGV